MGLGSLDIVLLIVSLLASASIGIYYGIRGLKSTPLEYLLGGRSMRPLPLAMSMTVGTVSAITIMGNAGEMYAFGTQLWIMDLGIALGMIIVAKAFIPIMYPLHVVSLFQYIERRFKSQNLRKATVVLQLIGGYMFIGFTLYPPSIALEFFTGLNIGVNIFIMGAICTLYSAFGGVKAVVYADVFQAIVMIVGVLAIVIQGSVNIGGLEKAFDIAYHGDRLEFFNFNLDPYQRHSFWLCLTFGLFFALSTYGVNQSQTQRFFSTGSVRQAQWVLYYAAMGMVFLKGIINLAGLVIYAHYKDCDPLTSPTNKLQDPAVMMAIYVLYVLVNIPGMSGVFVAAIYAAVLSSVSTQLNSMTALLWEDFLKEIPTLANYTEEKKGALQKIIVFLSGILGIVLGVAVSGMGTSFLRTLYAITGALSGPLIGLFLVAVYLPWINVKGAATGFAFSIVLSVWIAIGQLLTQSPPGLLPLSRDGCPKPILPQVNATTIFPVALTEALTEDGGFSFTATATPEGNVYGESEQATTAISFLENGTVPGINTSEEFYNATPAIIDTTVPDRNMYGLSYCLNSVWGTLICILVAIAVTGIVGTNTLDDVESTLISPSAWRAFKKTTFLQGRKPISKTFLRKAFTRVPRDEPNHNDAEDTRKSSQPSPVDKKDDIRDEDYGGAV